MTKTELEGNLQGEKEKIIPEKLCSNVAKHLIETVLAYANYRFRQTFMENKFRRVNSEDRCLLETDRHDTEFEPLAEIQIIVSAMINGHDVKGIEVQRMNSIAF